MINGLLDIIKMKVECVKFRTKNTLDELKSTSNNTVCVAHIDFVAMDVISVERAYGGDERTIVGYNKDNKFEEWNLYIDRGSHNKLVEDFKQYLAEK